MAYLYRVTGPVEATIDGHPYFCYTIKEKDVDANGQWMVGGLPKFFTITLYEAAVKDPGTPPNLNPRLGTRANWLGDLPVGDPDPASPIDEVGGVATPALLIRIPVSMRVTSLQGELFGRSAFGATGTIATVITRITLIEGH